MTSVQRIDPSAMLSDQLAEASSDLLRNLMSTFIQALILDGRRGRPGRQL